MAQSVGHSARNFPPLFVTSREQNKGCKSALWFWMIIIPSVNKLNRAFCRPRPSFWLNQSRFSVYFRPLIAGQIYRAWFLSGRICPSQEPLTVHSPNVRGHSRYLPCQYDSCCRVTLSLTGHHANEKRTWRQQNVVDAPTVLSRVWQVLFKECHL